MRRQEVISEVPSSIFVPETAPAHINAHNNVTKKVMFYSVKTVTPQNTTKEADHYQLIGWTTGLNGAAVCFSEGPVIISAVTLDKDTRFDAKIGHFVIPWKSQSLEMFDMN